MTGPIVGIGELLWDIYPDGRKVAGGAPFNFAFHCHQLGHPAVIVSRVGDDELGRELRERVRQMGLSDEYIQTDRMHPTGTVRVTLDTNGIPSYFISEDVAWDHIQLLDTLLELMPRSAAICHGTLAQRSGASRSTIRRLKSRSWDQPSDTPLIILDLNLRQPFFDRHLLIESLGMCNWVKLNSEELEHLAKILRLPNLVESQRAVDLRLIKHSDMVCVTRGADGCHLTTQTEELDEPGVPAKVVDTVGSGDAFTAAMVCLHLEGRPLRECARFANHYAARVCEHVGATPRIDRVDVERASGLAP